MVIDTFIILRVFERRVIKQWIGAGWGTEAGKCGQVGKISSKYSLTWWLMNLMTALHSNGFNPNSAMHFLTESWQQIENKKQYSHFLNIIL